MKNIILSIIAVAALVGIGYFLFSGDNKDVVGVNIDTTNQQSNQEANAAQILKENYGTSTTPADTTAPALQQTTQQTGAAATSTTQSPTTKMDYTKPHQVTLSTNFGDIVVQTIPSDAPKASTNFISLVEKGFYNNLTFHRVIKGFMIQGGDPKGTGTGGPGYTFEDELDPNTPSAKAGYKKGVLAMANSGPNTNGSQFFIMLADYPLPHNYTIFGNVIGGQSVVDKIGLTKTGANDLPVTPVIIKSAMVK